MRILEKIECLQPITVGHPDIQQHKIQFVPMLLHRGKSLCSGGCIRDDRNVSTVEHTPQSDSDHLVIVSD